MARPPLPVGQHGSIRIRKFGDVWRAATYVRDPDGRRREIRREAKTKQAANTALQQALADRPGVGSSGLTRDTRLAAVADQWLARVDSQVEAGDIAPNTARVYHSIWDNHIKAAVGQLRLREATTGRLDAFILSMRRPGRSSSQVKTARTILNGILGHAVRAEAIAANPMREVSAIKSGPVKAARALTAEERQQWLDLVSEDYLALRHDVPDLTRFLLNTGVRIGESLAVTFDEVDFAAATVRIDWTIVPVVGKGLQRNPTKTRAGERTLRLTPWTLRMLEDRLQVFGEGPVFPSAAGTWRDPSNTSRVFREARKRAGFEWVTTHTFRKTVATVLDEGGLTAREIADQLGHTRISMTQDVYMGRRAVTDRAVTALTEAERPRLE